NYKKCAGGMDMKGNPEDRAILLGQFISETKSTVRAAAAAFGISKSTVHKDVTMRLRKQNRVLYEEVQKVLRINKCERHLRGGMATKRKYHPESFEI
ncbi:MAG: sporulation transcriptional regulator SpoIIID, partial [Oscillospiraceae bacterium]